MNIPRNGKKRTYRPFNNLLYCHIMNALMKIAGNLQQFKKTLLYTTEYFDTHSRNGALLAIMDKSHEQNFVLWYVYPDKTLHWYQYHLLSYRDFIIRKKCCGYGSVLCYRQISGGYLFFNPYIKKYFASWKKNNKQRVQIIRSTIVYLTDSHYLNGLTFPRFKNYSISVFWQVNVRWSYTVGH